VGFMFTISEKELPGCKTEYYIYSDEYSHGVCCGMFSSSQSVWYLPAADVPSSVPVAIK
jgi:hypothetical protein